MGQKVNPIGFRLGYSFFWTSSWCATGSTYSTLLHEDLFVTKYLNKKAKDSKILIDTIKIKRTFNNVGVFITSSGTYPNKEIIEQRLSTFLAKPTQISFHICRKSAHMIASSLKLLLEDHVSLVLLRKQAIHMVGDLVGVKIIISGRFNGAAMARREVIHIGKVPLQTIAALVDYSTSTAYTRYGTFGIKVWINKDTK